MLGFMLPKAHGMHGPPSGPVKPGKQVQLELNGLVSAFEMEFAGHRVHESSAVLNVPATQVHLERGLDGLVSAFDCEFAGHCTHFC